jgi:hypothetical protein
MDLTITDTMPREQRTTALDENLATKP